MALPVVIFGNGQVAELALARLRELGAHAVVGFVVDRPFVGQGLLHGLPVRPFDELGTHWPPEGHLMFVAVGPARVNRLRAERCAQVQALGYRLISVISPSARISPDAVIGANCTIGDGCIVLPYSCIGDDVHIGTASVIGHHARIGNHAFLAMRVTLAGSVTVEPHAVLGVGVTVRDRITVGESACVGAGVVLSADAKAGAVYAAPEPVRLPITSDQLPGLR